MTNDPGAQRQHRRPLGPWIVLALLVGLATLTGIALFRPTPRFETAAPVEAPLTTREQVEKGQAKFADDEAARRDQP